MINLFDYLFLMNTAEDLIIIMVIFKCYFYIEHSPFIKKTKNGMSIELGKNQQIESTVHNNNDYF